LYADGSQSALTIPLELVVITVSDLSYILGIMADSSVANPKCNESQQTMLLGLSWGLLSLAIVAVLLRLYFRLFALRNGIRGDDYTILAALVCRPSRPVTFIPIKIEF